MPRLPLIRLSAAFSHKGRRHLASWDKKYLWHPFTQHAEWDVRPPVVIQSGRGVWLKDIHGRRFIDGVSSLWVNVWGHRHPVLDQAITKQLKKIAHSTFLGLTHEPAIRLARKLIEIAPNPPKPPFAKGGQGDFRGFFIPITDPQPWKSRSRWPTNTGN